LIHCDLHSGNILMEECGCLITDLGLCGPVDDKSSGKIYGITPYVAPEILQGKRNTKESDIYSVGMLLWEIFAGRPPLDDRAHDGYLILNIVLNGLRPPLLSNMPSNYSQMMQRCWNADPSKRPTIKELRKFFGNELIEIFKKNNNSNSIGNSNGGNTGNSGGGIGNG